MAQGLRIADIRPTRRGRFSLYSEEGFLFSVDGETLAQSGVAVGDTLTAGQLDGLQRNSDTRKAKDKALRYLSLRAYASGELYEKLCRSFDGPAAAAAVAGMQQLGLLDDAAFARSRAACLQGQKKSLREIRARLLALGLERELVEQALEELAPDGQQQALRQLIEKQYAARLARGEGQKVLAALVRRGFAPGEARAALAEYTQGAEPCEEEGGEGPWLSSP